MVSAPVLVTSDVCHAGNGCGLVYGWVSLSGSDVSDCRTRALAVCIAVKAFLEKRDQVYEMVRESEILLCDLELCHELGLRHEAEKRAERFAWLEVNRSVLDLYENVVAELSVKRLELLGCLVCSVGTLWRVYECTPHYDAVIWLESVCKHVCSVCVSPAEVLRTRKTFGISLYKETSEVRNERIDLSDLVGPPLAHFRYERV